jgi:hypothetical protein
MGLLIVALEREQQEHLKIIGLDHVVTQEELELVQKKPFSMYGHPIDK